MTNKFRYMTGLALAFAVILVGCDAAGGSAGNDEASGEDGDGVELADADQEFQWTAQAYAIAGTEPYDLIEEWAARVETGSGGRIQIEMNSGGSLVAYGDEREALTDGVIDVSLNAPAFFSGDDPAFGAWGVMLAAPLEHPERARYLLYQWAHHGGGLEIARELYEPYDIYPIGIAMTPNEPVHSTTPIRSLADLEGLQVRAAPGLVSAMFDAVGANPVSMGGGEIYSALDTGVIDAAEFVGATENVQLGLHEVADHVLWPGFHSPQTIVDVTVRTETWNELPEDLQSVMEDSIQWLNLQLDHYMAVQDYEVFGTLESEHGVEVTSLSSEEMEEVADLALEVTQEYRDESEMSARLIDSYLDFMRLAGYLD